MKKIILLLFIVSLSAGLFSSFMIDSRYAYFEYIEYLEKRGIIETQGTFPVNSDAVLSDISSFLGTGSLTQTDRYIIDFLLRDIRRHSGLSIRDGLSAGYSDEGFVLENNGSAYIPVWQDRISAQMTFTTIYPYEEDTLSMHRLKPWQGTASYFTNASVTFGTERNFISAGRMMPSWGRGVFDNMFISDSIYEPDCIYIHLTRGILSFDYFSTVLTPYNYSYNFYSEQTFASFHKLDIRLPFSNTLSFKEAVLYRSILPEPYYVNPFIMYYFTQWNSKSDDNIIWSVQMQNRSLDAASFNFELFIDDFQYDTPMMGPNKVGLYASTSVSLPFLKSVIADLEYVRISKWTGTHQFDDLKYSFHRRPIMYYYGPDSESAGICISGYFNSIKLSAAGIYKRHGEGSISLPYETEGGTMTPEFPSGIVETTMTGRFSASWNIMDNIEAKGYIEYNDISNLDNIQNNNLSDLSFRIEGVVYL